MSLSPDLYFYMLFDIAYWSLSGSGSALTLKLIFTPLLAFSFHLFVLSGFRDSRKVKIPVQDFHASQSLAKKKERDRTVCMMLHGIRWIRGTGYSGKLVAQQILYCVANCDIFLSLSPRAQTFHAAESRYGSSFLLFVCM